MGIVVLAIKEWNFIVLEVMCEILRAFQECHFKGGL